MKIISSARLLECSRSLAGKGIYNYQMYSLNEKPELVNQLCEYNLLIGVDGYELDEAGVISWVFKGNHYTTKQVERLIKMKAFA